MSDIFTQLREWRIVCRVQGGALRYFSPQKVTPEQVEFIRQHKEEILADLATRQQFREEQEKTLQITLPTAFAPDGTFCDDIWEPLAARLLVEVPNEDRRSVRDHYAARLTFWRSAGIDDRDVLRMAYVDLETLVAERFNRRLAVWFDPNGPIRAEGIAAEAARRPVAQAQVAAKVVTAAEALF